MRMNVFIALAIAVVSATTFADEVADAKKQLTRQQTLLNQIAPYVDRIDLARIYVLNAFSQNTLKSIEDNGLANMKTIKEYQKLIVAYRYSVAFFKDIETELTREAIVEVLKINEAIIAAWGFDDSPYTQITASVYGQMKKLLEQLSTLPISNELKIKISNISPVIGKALAMAEAKGGDRRTVYPHAEKAFLAIESLYPDFNKIAASDSAFRITLEIQGLNEFYAEFAEFGEGE